MERNWLETLCSLTILIEVLMVGKRAAISPGQLDYTKSKNMKKGHKATRKAVNDSK